MVGYAQNHAPDTYRMYDPSTGSVIMTRDIVWTKNGPPPTTTIDHDPLQHSTTLRREVPHDENYGPHLIPDDNDDDEPDI